MRDSALLSVLILRELAKFLGEEGLQGSLDVHREEVAKSGMWCKSSQIRGTMGRDAGYP